MVGVNCKYRVFFLFLCFHNILTVSVYLPLNLTPMKNHIARISLFLLAVTLYSQRHAAQTTDDNVVITECEDTYIFGEKEGVPFVRNTTGTTYVAERMGTVIQPHAYYGEFISLDGASAKGGGKAEYKSITPDNVFFDDTKVCYFNIRLDRKGKSTHTKFKRTFHNLRYFTRIPLSEDFFVRHKRVTFVIPQSLSQFRLIERNFTPDIQSERSVNAQGDSIISYIITDMPALRSEQGMPATEYITPSLLVRGAFADYSELHRWSREMSKIDCRVKELDSLLTGITRGCTSDMERIRATYAWVQRHIRYIAFEAGIAGHRPDTPAEVLRKRYGDCKGMALLLRTLLRAQGFDARLTDIGTEDIPYRMTEIPTLAAVNHMLCTLFHNGRTFYLDATCKYIPLEYIPQHIQGQEALTETKTDDVLVHTIPVLESDAATDSLHCACTLTKEEDGTAILTGRTARLWRGDMKEWFLTKLHARKQEEQEDFLTYTLKGQNCHASVRQMILTGYEPNEEWAMLEGNIKDRSTVQQAGRNIYLGMNGTDMLFDQPVDTTRRRQDYCLPLRCRIVRQTEVELPEGISVTHIPENFRIETPQGTLSCSFRTEGRRIVFRKMMDISRRRITLGEITTWNKALRRWHEAAGEQVIVTLN